jgi:RND family efflux transporter MFP subunit
MKIPRRLKRFAAVLLPVVAGAAVLVLAVKNRRPPRQLDAAPEPRAVRSVTVQSGPVTPRVIGHGLVEPPRTWRGIAQVAGRVIQRAAALEDGRLIAAGELLLSIDPASYQFAVQELEAKLEQIDASDAELRTRRDNTAALLGIEQELLASVAKEVERQKELLATEAGSEAAYDAQQRTWLQQRQRVQDLENTLALLDPEAARLRADRLATEARLATARLDLEHTAVRAPFDCRIGEVHVEESQFVRAGDALCEAYDIAAAEVRAQVPLQRLRALIGERRGEPIEFDRLVSREWIESLGIDAVVRLRLGSGLAPSWEARLARMGAALDPQTRTMEVVVRVDDPFGQARLGERPPLVPGMYCEVELRGAPREGILLPRAALHAGVVHLVEAGVLREREVVTGLVMGDHVVVEDGLRDGEQVVVSDLVPAVPGMPLAPRRDAELESTLARVAREGAAPVQRDRSDREQRR